MKKLSVILLLLSLTVPFTGTYLFLQYNKNKIRKEVAGMIMKGFKENDLFILKFTHEESKTKLNWKHSREFEFKGQMYDIVQQTRHGDSVYYTCYKDHKETKLKQQKENLISKAMGQDPTRKSQSEKLNNFLKTFFSQGLYSLLSYSPEVSVIRFSLFVFHYSLFTPSPPSPPPKCS